MLHYRENLTLWGECRGKKPQIHGEVYHIHGEQRSTNFSYKGLEKKYFSQRISSLPLNSAMSHKSHHRPDVHKWSHRVQENFTKTHAGWSLPPPDLEEELLSWIQSILPKMYDRFDAIPSRMPTRVYVEIFTELMEEKGQRIALMWWAAARGGFFGKPVVEAPPPPSTFHKTQWEERGHHLSCLILIGRHRVEASFQREKYRKCPVSKWAF